MVLRLKRFAAQALILARFMAKISQFMIPSLSVLLLLAVPTDAKMVLRLRDSLQSWGEAEMVALPDPSATPTPVLVDSKLDVVDERGNPVDDGIPVPPLAETDLTEETASCTDSSCEAPEAMAEVVVSASGTEDEEAPLCTESSCAAPEPKAEPKMVTKIETTQAEAEPTAMVEEPPSCTEESCGAPEPAAPLPKGLADPVSEAEMEDAKVEVEELCDDPDALVFRRMPLLSRKLEPQQAWPTRCP